jgi:hypothetical protein
MKTHQISWNQFTIGLNKNLGQEYPIKPITNIMLLRLVVPLISHCISSITIGKLYLISSMNIIKPRVRLQLSIQVDWYLKSYNLEPGKHRVRVSLMPQIYSSILEPNTDSIQTRIDCIPKLQEQFEVHINFSPIIYTDNWLDEYNQLFETLSQNKIDVKCECIFLTYNQIQFNNNSQIVNDLCWKPDIQETKNSHYADNNIRYRHDLKNQMISDFCKVYSQYFKRSNIRYIF